MATAATGPGPSLQIRRTFAAPREKVFEAWTQREKLEKWWCRNKPDNLPRYVEFDLRVGGTNRMEVRIADGSVYHQRITFREIKVPEKLIFTYAWEQFSPSGQKDEEQDGTLVTVEFHERGNSTEIVVTHEFFGNAEQRDGHNTGWNASLDVLAQSLKAQA